MQKRMALLLLLACALAASACGSVGKAVKLECPRPAPVAASLMQEPQTERKVRAELFEPPPSATPRSEGSKPK